MVGGGLVHYSAHMPLRVQMMCWEGNRGKHPSVSCDIALFGWDFERDAQSRALLGREEGE